jgi:quercetin dioxygenase-like cupin family protein
MAAKLTQGKLSVGISMLLTVVLLVAIAAIALNARAGQHEELTMVPPEGEMFIQGNEFPDDFRAEYRLKFGESDVTRPGMAEDAPPHQQGARETFERLVNDGSNVHMGRLTFAAEEDGQIGGVPWHTHPGTVLISVAEGDFVFVFADDCVAREYSAGGALVDPGNTVHTAYNPSEDTETVVMATLLGAPAEGPATIPVDEAEGAALDEECGIDRDDIASAHSAH